MAGSRRSRACSAAESASSSSARPSRSPNRASSPTFQSSTRTPTSSVVDKPAGLVRASRCRPCARNAFATPGHARGGRRRAVAARDRSPTRQADVWAACRREGRGSPSCAQDAIAERSVIREYSTLVIVVHRRAKARSTRPIGRDPRRRRRMAIDGNAAREARTHFTLVESLTTSSLLAVRLETGRTHQDTRAFSGDRPSGLRGP